MIKGSINKLLKRLLNKFNLYLSSVYTDDRSANTLVID